MSFNKERFFTFAHRIALLFLGVMPLTALCGQIEIGGEMLYMQPSRADLKIAIVDHRPYVPPAIGGPIFESPQPPPVGRIEKFNPRYRFGFRVVAGYVFREPCCPINVDLTAEYTWLHTRDRKTLVPTPGGTNSGGLWVGDTTNTNYGFTAPGPPLLTNTNFFPQEYFNASGNPGLPFEVNAFLRASTRFLYDAGDLQLGLRLCCRSLRVRGFAGIHAANLYFSYTNDVQGTINPGQTQVGTLVEISQAQFTHIDMRAQSWAIGPKAGLSFSCPILCGVGVGGRFGAGALTGRRRYHYQWAFTALVGSTGAIDDQDFLDTPESFKTLVTPEFDGRLGLNYRWQWGALCRLFFEVGYEIISYVNFVNKGPIFRQDRGLLGDDLDSFNLNGLYLRLDVAF